VAQQRRPARSVGASRRSSRAWSFYLQAFTSIRRKPVSLPQSGDFEGALGGSCFPRIGVIATAAQRLHDSSMTAGFQREVSLVAEWLIDQSRDLRGFR
jgi:hypothetical protein